MLEQQDTQKRIDDAIAFLKKNIEFFSAPFEEPEIFNNWAKTNKEIHLLSHFLFKALKNNSNVADFAEAISGKLLGEVDKKCLKYGDDTRIKTLILQEEKEEEFFNEQLLEAIEKFQQNQNIIDEFAFYKKLYDPLSQDTLKNKIKESNNLIIKAKNKLLDLIYDEIITNPEISAIKKANMIIDTFRVVKEPMNKLAISRLVENSSVAPSKIYEIHRVLLNRKIKNLKKNINSDDKYKHQLLLIIKKFIDNHDALSFFDKSKIIIGTLHVIKDLNEKSILLHYRDYPELDGAYIAQKHQQLLNTKIKKLKKSDQQIDQSKLEFSEFTNQLIDNKSNCSDIEKFQLISDILSIIANPMDDSAINNLIENKNIEPEQRKQIENCIYQIHQALLNEKIKELKNSDKQNDKAKALAAEGVGHTINDVRSDTKSAITFDQVHQAIKSTLKVLNDASYLDEYKKDLKPFIKSKTSKVEKVGMAMLGVFGVTCLAFAATTFVATAGVSLPISFGLGMVGKCVLGAVSAFAGITALNTATSIYAREKGKQHGRQNTIERFSLLNNPKKRNSKQTSYPEKLLMLRKN